MIHSLHLHMLKVKGLLILQLWMSQSVFNVLYSLLAVPHWALTSLVLQLQ